jgi:hypothetical protein
MINTMSPRIITILSTCIDIFTSRTSTESTIKRISKPISHPMPMSIPLLSLSNDALHINSYPTSFATDPVTLLYVVAGPFYKHKKDERKIEHA